MSAENVYRQAITTLGLTNESQTDRGALFALLTALAEFDSEAPNSGNPFSAVLNRLQPIIGDGFYFQRLRELFATASSNYDRKYR